MSLQSSSVLVKLTLRQWDGYTKDKRVSERVDQTFNTNGSAGNYNKRLFDRGVLAPIRSTMSDLYAQHRSMTMPWCYEGVSLLPSKVMLPYCEMMRRGRDTIEREVENLRQQYPIHMANQMSRLGAMFNADDYPTEEELISRYGVEWQFFPVPDAGHFLVDVEQDLAQQVKHDLTNTLASVYNGAASSLYARMTDLLEHMHERLADPENIFHASMLDNARAVAQVMPALNIFDDQKLTEASQRLQQMIAHLEPQDLRKNLQLRQQVANEAFDLVTFLKNRAA
jgi:hypothetical protein